MGSSFVIHQIDRFKGHLVVQSEGKGLVTDGSLADEGGNQYAVVLNGVSIYSPNTGIMTERVYALRGETTASSDLADGWGGSMYFHSGRVRMLNETEKVPCGTTRPVLPPGATAIDGLSVWQVME
jgi:hypothetical protein